jgi:hypothetical protein
VIISHDLYFFLYLFNKESLEPNRLTSLYSLIKNDVISYNSLFRLRNYDYFNNKRKDLERSKGTVSNIQGVGHV